MFGRARRYVLTSPPRGRSSPDCRKTRERSRASRRRVAYCARARCRRRVVSDRVSHATRTRCRAKMLARRPRGLPRSGGSLAEFRASTDAIPDRPRRRRVRARETPRDRRALTSVRRYPKWCPRTRGRAAVLVRVSRVRIARAILLPRRRSGVRIVLGYARPRGLATARPGGIRDFVGLVFPPTLTHSDFRS